MYEHHPGVNRSKRHRRQRIVLCIVLLSIALLTAYLFLFNRGVNQTQPVLDLAAESSETTQEVPIDTTIRVFSGDEFKDLYNSFSYPNTTQITDPPIITSSVEVDAVIRLLAEERGYRLRSLARDTEGLADGEPVQLLAERHWKELKAEAATDSVVLTVTWAFRSVDEQRDLFLNELRGRGISNEQIVSRGADAAVLAVLQTVAPPGYSRHHTGFTVDLTCGLGGLTVFQETVCYEWLSYNNYERAKKHGWVPSYPKGASLQGPEPEAWEYIWVGVEALYQTP